MRNLLNQWILALGTRARRPRRSPAAKQLVVNGGKYRRVRLDLSTKPGIENTTAVYNYAPPSGGGAVAFVICLRVRTDMVALSMSLPNGTALEYAICHPRTRAHDLVFFAPLVETPLHFTLHSHERSFGIVEDLAIVTFDKSAVDPTRLMPEQASAASRRENVYGFVDFEDAIGRLREHVFSQIRTPVAVPFLGRMRLFLEPGDELSRVLFVCGTYEPESLLLLRGLLPAGGTFVDVGANCGIYTLYAANLVGSPGRVISFEPSEREFRRLQGNVSLNAVPQVSLVNAAVTDRPGTVALRVAEPGHAGLNTLGSRFPYKDVALQAVVDVPSVTLDTTLAQAAIDRCDLIKIDVEGSELSVLRGAAATLERFRPIILLELFDEALASNNASALELVNWLHAHRYTIHDIDPVTRELLPGLSLPMKQSRNVVAFPHGP